MALQKIKYLKTLKYTQGAKLVGLEGFAVIQPTQIIPTNVISFNEWRSKKDSSSYWVDHFIDDRQFNCVFNNCDRYIDRYRKAAGVIGTDFSAYRDMPLWMRKESVGKNRAIDYYLQSHGVNVILVASFAYPHDCDWSLDGLPRESSVAISTNGSMRNLVSRIAFIEGVTIIQERLRPTHLIISGGPVPELDKLYNNIIYYKNYSQRWADRRKNNG